MHKIGFTEVVYKERGCIEAGRMHNHVYLYFEAISKGNTLKKIGRNWKRLIGSYKKLQDIKCIILALKVHRSGI